MDLFKRFVFGQAFNRNIRAVTGEERTTERFSVFEHKPFWKSFFPPPRSEACLTTSVLALFSAAGLARDSSQRRQGRFPSPYR